MEDFNLLNLVIGLIEMDRDNTEDGVLPYPLQEKSWHISLLEGAYDMSEETASTVYNLMIQIAPAYCEKANIPLGSINIGVNGTVKISVNSLTLTLQSQAEDYEMLKDQALWTIRSLYDDVLWYYSGE